MFNKKTKLFFITLVFMLSISAVAAVETNTNDDVSIGDVNEEPPSGVVQEISNGVKASDALLSTAINGNTSNDYLSASGSNPTLNADDVTMYYKNGSSYIVYLLDNGKPVKNAPVRIVINDVVYDRQTNSIGKVSINLKSLNVGNYTASTTYGQSTLNTKISVLPVIIGDDVATTYGSTASYAAKFLDNHGQGLANTNVNFTLDGKRYGIKTDSSGVASLPLNLSIGSYKVYAIHPNGYKIYNMITVTSSIVSADLSKRFNSSTDFRATFYGNNGKLHANRDVRFTVDGKSYVVRTDSSGVAVLPITLDVGKYTITSYNPSTRELKDNTIAVKSSIIVSGLKMRFNSTNGFSATFYGANDKIFANRDVKFIVDGSSYVVRTDSNGIASLPICLSLGKHTVVSVNPGTHEQKTNTVAVESSIISSDLTKRFNSSSDFRATFYGRDDNLHANRDIRFTVDGESYVVRTDSNGVATLPVCLSVGNHNVTSYNPSTREQKINLISVKSSIIVSGLNTVYNSTNPFSVTFYGVNEKVFANRDVKFIVDGRSYVVRTDSNGKASLPFCLDVGKHTVVSVNPGTHEQKTNTVAVASSIIASDLTMSLNSSASFSATFYGKDGKVYANKYVRFDVAGESYSVPTNANGVASLPITLDIGTYTITSINPATGQSVDNKITVTGKRYNEYGVSSDGSTILAIGRPSAAGEVSKYGYYFYKTEFLRTCSYCGGHNLYWDIFWAGNEYSNYGMFPATGRIEGSSAEGAIFCADCDSDWSVFGHNHGGGGGDLTVVTETVSSTKAEAYELKSGDYVNP